jgi:hypothetical protein
LNVSQLEDLEKFLESQGIVWGRLERKEYLAAINQWNDVFGSAFSGEVRHKEGEKARYAVSQVESGELLLLSIANETRLLRSSAPGMRWGYRCRALRIPDLSQFCNLDFAMAASDFSWTMVYTHEDDACFGPYFTEKDWLVPPDQNLAREERRTGRRSRRR